VGITDTNDVFYFDIQDLNLVKEHNWYLDFDKYVITRIQGKNVKLHKLIMDSPNSIIHHLNKCEWDNRRCNLKYVTNIENALTAKLSKHNNSGAKGVDWQKQSQKWRARIKINKQEIYLGSFKYFEDAVHARENAEAKYIRKELLEYDNIPLSK